MSHRQSHFVWLLLDNKPDARKIALLLTVADPQAIEVFNTFEFSEGEDKDKYDTILEKFSAYCSPQKNVVYETVCSGHGCKSPTKCLIALLRAPELNNECSTEQEIENHVSMVIESLPGVSS